MSQESQSLPPSPEYPAELREMSGMATASLVFGLLSLVCGPFASLPAIMYGRKALSEIKRSEGRLEGEKRANCGLLLGYAVTIVCSLALLVAIISPGFARESSAARRASCQNNLKQIGFEIRGFADRNAGVWPALDPRPGHLMFAKEEIYLDPAILVCHADRKAAAMLKDIEPRPANVAHFLEGSGYWYLGYALPTEEDGMAFVEAYMELSKAGKGLPKALDLVSPRGLILPALKDGIEQAYVQDSSDPATIARAQAAIPVIVERPSAHEGGANVLYMDGHVEFVKYPGKYPMSERFVKALESIQELRTE